jgi:hypothetical protein
LNQEQHHRKKIRQEYVDFLQKFEIPFEERFLFDFYKQGAPTELASPALQSSSQIIIMFLLLCVNTPTEHSFLQTRLKYVLTYKQSRDIKSTHCLAAPECPHQPATSGRKGFFSVLK